MFTDKIRELKIREEGQLEEGCSLSELTPVSHEGQLALGIKGTDYYFDPVGLGALCRQVGVPYNYLEDLPLELQLKNLKNGLEKTKQVKISISGQGLVRGVCSKSYATPALSKQIEVINEALDGRGKLETYRLYDELVYALVVFPEYACVDFSPAIFMRISDTGGKEDIICGLQHAGGVFVPYAQPNMYLWFSQSYAKYSIEITKSVIDTMCAIIKDSHEKFADFAGSIMAPVADADEWTKELALTSIPKSFIKTLREGEEVTKYKLCELALVKAASVKHCFDLLLKLSKEFNTEFIDLWAI